MRDHRSPIIAAFVTCLLLVASAKAIEFAGGTGEPNDPYQIATAEQLGGLGDSPDLWDQHFRLVADIDLIGYERTSFPPIGRWLSTGGDRPFRGTFDGSGYAIANLSQTCWDTDNVGLFGHVVGPDAEVRNLTLINPHVYARNGENVGSLVGRLENGVVRDCHVSRAVILAEGGSSVGSLAGRVQEGTVEGCHATLCLVSGGDRVGGLVGAQSGIVARCHAAGDVSGEICVGGLVGSGESGCRLENCYSLAAVTGKTSVGGLLGCNEGVVFNAYSAGPVLGDTQVGGLIGAGGGQGDAIECFWDVQTSGQQNSAGGTGRTTAEMKAIDTFFRWSGCGGKAVWTILEGQDYPRLAWEGRQGAAIALTPLVGEGTKESPYLIRSPEELNRIGLMSCTWGGHFRLTVDLDLSGFSSRPFYVIGTDQIPFTGSFDGAGHAISHFRQISTDPNYAGLFGYIDGPEAEIRDLTLVDPNVAGTIPTGPTSRGAHGRISYMGALAGFVERGRIVRCAVADGHVSGGTFVGGLAGYNQGTIAESYAEGAVSSSWLAAGLVGINAGTIQNSYATGVVTASSYTGGLAGANTGFIAWCYAACETPQYEPTPGVTRRLHIASLTPCPLVAHNDYPAEVVCSFWDSGAGEQPDADQANARNAEQMRMARTFVAWGACGNEGIWTIDDGQDYPRLSWQGLEGEPLGPTPLSDLLAGTGTEGDPYLIYTADDLLMVSWFRRDWGGQFKLMADIDLSTGTAIDPIGSETVPFTGVFDGGGHCLRGLICRYESGSNIGLFGHVADPNARIVDLAVTDPNILAVGGANVGALVAWLEDGSIANCRVEGGGMAFTSSVWDGAFGGLVGRSDGGRICDPRCTTTITASHCSLVGGLVGRSTSGRIARCHYTGTLAGGDCTGGLVGANSGVVSSCSAAAQISLPEYGDGGGLVGSNSGWVTCSYATCNMEARWADTAGGLVGFNSGAIGNCYAIGSISWGWLDDRWADAVGGLVGESYYEGSVVNCFAVGKLFHEGPTKQIDGLIGRSSGVRIDCFCSMDVSGDGYDPVRTGSTDAEIADVNTYVKNGWDFAGETANGTSDLWEMAPGDARPVLVCFSDIPRRHSLVGAGTAEDPYRIATAEDLGAVCHYDDPAWFTLTADIDLSGVAWSTAPIPEFDGHLDGAGFVVSNLTIHGGGYLGLFGMLGERADVKNLGIVDANIVFADNAEAGGIMAARNYGSIHSCYAVGELRAWANYHHADRIGGFVGYNGGDIADCYCRAGMGGRLGYSGGLVSENAGRLSHSYAVTRVLPGWVLEGLNGLMSYDYGGRAVHCFWDVQTSGATGSAAGKGLTTAEMQDPGVYSMNGWAASDSQWILDRGKDYPRLAWEGTSGQPIPEPMIDWLEGAGTPEDPYRVSTPEQLLLVGAAGVLWDKSFVLASDLDLSTIAWVPIGVCPGTDFTGGFDGAGHVIRHLRIDATATGTPHSGLFGWIGPHGRVCRLSLQDASVKGGTWSDGLGVLAGGSNGWIEECCARGTINGASGNYAGGLVGMNCRGTIVDSYAIVDTLGEISIAGGLVGTNDQGLLARCYGAGDVNGRYGSDSVGGLAGDNSSGSIRECYFLWSRVVAGRGGSYTQIVSQDNGLGIPLQESQMRQQGSFRGWDFATTWTTCEGTAFPHLRWEETCEP